MNIPLPGGLNALIDEADYPLVCHYHWSTASTQGRYYATSTYRGANGRVFYLKMHRMIVMARPGEQVDHINMDTLDNRRCNLRIATKGQNMRNRGPTARSTSGYKGVHWSKSANKWVAEIQMNGKKKYLGVFASADEAALAYNKAAIQLHGEFARLNKVEGGK
jgi:hypothetical protein